MRNLVMLGLLCVTFFPGQETFAQETKKSEPTSPRGSAGAEEAESSASLDETLDWIGTKLTDKGFFSNAQIGERVIAHSVVSENSFKVAKCQLSWIWKGNNGEGKMFVFNLTIDFADIDQRTGSQINAERDKVVVLETSGSKQSILYGRYDEYLKENPNFNYKHTTSGLKLYFHSAENAKRTLRAVRHAAKLCGGKPSVF